jgi:hypothetical protein
MSFNLRNYTLPHCWEFRPSAQGSANPFGRGIQFGFCRTGSMRWSEVKPKAIAGEAGKHMQVNVKDFLACDFAIREKQIDSVAGHTAGAQCLRQPLRDAKHLSAGIGMQSGKKTGVFVGDHQQMPGIHRSNVEERGAPIVFVNLAAWNLICENLAEDTVIHLFDR